MDGYAPILSADWLALMITLNFPRHFAYLAVATAVLILTQSGSTPLWIDRATFLFGLAGLLHATALAFALNMSGALPKGLLFIAITAVASANVPLMGAYIVGPLHFDGALGFLAWYGVSSAFGAAAYWALVRLFWLRNLTVLSLLQTVGLCVGATFASLLTFGLFTHQGRNESEIAQALPTIFWWLGFSLSLWIFARVVLTAKNRLEQSQIAPASMSQGEGR
jgi:hypothetical protein